MKFRAERQEFADAVAWSLRTVGDNVTLPALAGVRLEVLHDRLHLRSANADMTSDLSISVQAEREGVALVRGRLLGDIVRSLPNESVSADADGDRLLLRCGRARFDLRLMPVADFQTLPAPAPDAPVAVLKAEEFARTAAQVSRAASTETGHRLVLTGVNLEATERQLTAAATDSYRLAVRSIGWDQGTDATVLLPRRALEEARFSSDMLGGEVRLILQPAQVTFDFVDRRLTTRLLEGRFPDYRQLLPAGFERRLTVDRLELMDVVRRVSVVGERRATVTPVTLHLTADTVRVTVDNGEVGQAEEALPGQLEGEPLQIAFNPRYLIDGLEAAGSEQIVLEFRDELKPAVLRPTTGGGGGDESEADQGFVYLLMPVRL